ncbi:hypothetical protein DN069_32305 [Streptacidiphilus pinicola]|uniref:MFS transporter n=1 Tax=Streptacidiphilus pinicola TaxID=2219663 RepID=A0A2X0K1U7_9ACTN|nr:MFS transporter [Streptacidiphilus pinicola]RAG81539.1 hypothetical protein DN069_32305 [Streptacidiphilus pinicola]
MTTTTAVARHREPLATLLTFATFVSYFAIAMVEFSVPFVAVATLGANSLVIATLGICRFAPQVVLARAVARIVERHDQRTVMLAAELLRVLAFLLAALAIALTATAGLGVLILANTALACASCLTDVSAQVMIPAAFRDDALPGLFSRLQIAESTGDALAPFLTGLALGAFGISSTFLVAGALAASACTLLARLPRIRTTPTPAPVADAVPAGAAAAAEAPTVRRRAGLTAGLRTNLATKPLRITTLWAVSYNFGQSAIGALLLVTLLHRTEVTPAVYGLIGSCAVLFAVLGAAVAERLPARLRGGLGTSVFGSGAVAAYTLLGVGACVGGGLGLGLILLGFVCDEFCSGVVLVRVRTFRARAIAEHDRAIAVAAYRAVNMTAVPAGYAVGGLAGVLFGSSATLLTVGLLMLAPAALMLSRSIREAT